TRQTSRRDRESARRLARGSGDSDHSQRWLERRVFNMDEKDIEKFMVQDFIVTDSDGSDGHPRKYGTFPKIFREYVRDRHVLTLQQAIERSSARTAKMFGFKDRGVLAENAIADVIVFDAANFTDRSTYEQPTLLAEGMKYVLVNGTLAIDDGKFTG